MRDTAAIEKPVVVCKGCTMHLIRICYGRHGWFRLVREPLIVCMRILAWRNHIDARAYRVNKQECHGCIRFMKTGLQEKSPTFRFFNNRIGRRFNKLRDSMLQPSELDEAKRIAVEAMSGRGDS